MLEIRKAPLGRPSRDFLDVVDGIYAGDPHYIRPLDFEIRDRLNPKANPFFEHGEGVMFTAHRNGRCVGRATAQLDWGHLRRYGDETGFFGFFDTIDDEEVAKGLLAEAEVWVRSKGMKRIQGPVSLSINQELGCLVDGFDTPPVVMMPHHRAYQGGLIERCGYTKAKDVYAWHYTVGDLNTRTRRARDEIAAMPEVSARTVSVSDLDRDVELVVDMFNDAWADNWGFVPLTRREVQKMAKDFRLILMPEITRIVSIEGEPAAFAIAIPDLNTMIGDLHGKLSPLGIAKILYRLKVRGPHKGRLVFLGIRRKWRRVRKYAGLSAFLYGEMNDEGRKLGIKTGELSWTLEDNSAVNAGIRSMGARIYKTYRVYSKPLSD